MQKVTIRRIGVLSSAKITGILYTGLGFLLVLVMSPFLLLTIALDPDSNPALAVSMVVLLMMLFLLPVFYGIVGFIGGAVSAWLYNIVAGFVGGLEMEWESAPSDKVEPADASTSWDYQRE